jgi:hypothetical protein
MLNYILVCCPVFCEVVFTQLHKNILPPSSMLKQAEDGDGMFLRNVVSTYKSTRCYNPQDQYRHYDNLTSHTINPLNPSGNYMYHLF